MREGLLKVCPTGYIGGSGHISANRVGFNRRECPLEFKAMLGVTGSLGISVNLLTATDEELEEIAKYVSLAKEIRETVQFGTSYKLRSIYNDNAWCQEYVSADGNEIYFSGCGWENGFGSCDIYCIEFKNGKWSKPKNLRSVNTPEWESQPCLSYDGKELYFVRSNRKIGTSDIYVSKRDDDGYWSEAKFLSSNVNSEGNEMAPFIHYDGRTLYFSSDNHLGMGGYDLFMSQRDENGEWSEAVNLGYPLNTDGDEINIVVLNDAKNAYISAVRKEGFGAYDIYEFELDERFRPERIEVKKPSPKEYYELALERQGSVVLRDVYFAFDSADLTSDSEDGINAVYNFLCSNPDKKVLIEGHTDDIGNEEYNLKLSEKRAASVKKALIDRGISPERIKTKGCGSTQPLSTNNFDDELKTLNRRVSMSLID
jgi:outer membrane protein OmpA-like peptidoglycan-associated protein/YHS domain-containing protein